MGDLWSYSFTVKSIETCTFRKNGSIEYRNGRSRCLLVNLVFVRRARILLGLNRIGAAEVQANSPTPMPKYRSTLRS
jgi:hypothetical protein